MRYPFSALYIHIPFCASRCAYCDFVTRAARADDPEIDNYIEKLILSIRRASKADLLKNIRSIYIGGGTPSFIGSARLSELLYALSPFVNISKNTEVTMEANPDSLNENMLKDMRALGVNRVSIGVQSLDEDVLLVLGRAHNVKQALEALYLTRDIFDNVSADIICGVPGQNLGSLENTIETIVDTGVPHISAYPLTIEKNTVLFRKIEQGNILDVDDDTQASHLELVEKILTERGFLRYEVASYCKPGYKCNHNSAYWTGLPYLGLGYGGSSMFYSCDLYKIQESKFFEIWGLKEIETPNDTANSPKSSYRTRLTIFENNPFIETLSKEEAAREDAMLGMRMSQGLSLEKISALVKACPELEEAFTCVTKLGLAHEKDERIMPTEKGWLLGNELYGALWNCAND